MAEKNDIDNYDLGTSWIEDNINHKLQKSCEPKKAFVYALIQVLYEFTVFIGDMFYFLIGYLVFVILTSLFSFKLFLIFVCGSLFVSFLFFFVSFLVNFFYYKRPHQEKQFNFRKRVKIACLRNVRRLLKEADNHYGVKK